MSAANSSPNRLVCCCRTLLLLTLLASGSTVAQSNAAQRLPITLDADSSEFDLRNDQILYRGLRISQGSIGIEADNGITKITRGSKLDFADSVWKFDGNVRIEIETARIACESAELFFENHTLQRAEVKGNPAKFSDLERGAGKPIKAQANAFDYDLANGQIRFAGNAKIEEGESEITGADLLYDLEKQRVNFRGDADKDERVRIVINPEDVNSKTDPDP